ncbi:isoprenyl transferase [Leadbetterella sp. DM7]|uniref:isoprenyl transferase n=1 Tax=Leadbetterella sp. DM7 TaxID=3235085 RepID=UPI00349EE3C1
MEEISLNNLPKHIAVIMDGNGRWAKSRGALRIFGHQNGIKAVRETVEACAELGVGYLTLYTFSTENWGRPKMEVDGIMDLLVKTIGDEVPRLHKNNVQLKCIGDMDALPEKARRNMEKGIDTTKNNTGLVLNIALSYSGKWDIIQATRKLASAVKSGEMTPEEIDEEQFSRLLSTYPAPEVDLLIRTGGDHRISNYLLWQSAYAELLFLDVLWPDFRKSHLLDAVRAFQTRDRRFGKTHD